MSAIGAGFGMNGPLLKAEARKTLQRCRGAVPVWIMPINRLADTFDFATAEFDVVIIDEASQCDLMAFLPIAIAKEVVIVGDHQQVSPSGIGQQVATVNNLIKEHLTDIPNAVLYDSKRSIYDAARESFGGLVCLLEHFRCTTDIIQFSNYLSYNGDIKPLRDDAKFEQQVVEYRVESALRRTKVNAAEAEAITSIILAAIEFDEYEGMTFGVISLVGNEQALDIEQQLRRRLPPEIYDSRRVICGNSAQFQGDERDVMFLSMVDTPTGVPLTLKQAASFQQRYNVAASRVKNQMWVVHSLNAATDLKAGDLRKRLIDHARDPKAVTREIEKAEARAESAFEASVIKRLVAARYAVRPQWKVGRYRIDMVVQDGSRRLAVECDGDRYHGPDKMEDDMNRQAILGRLGWKFHRIRGTEFFRDPDAAMIRLFARLNELEIFPNAQVRDDCGSPDSESLTQRLIRRAAEIRQSWDEPDDGETANLLSFHPEPEDDSESVEADPILTVPELGRVSEGQDEQRRESTVVQTQLVFDDPDSVEPSQNSVSTTSLAYLDRTETQIVNLIQSQPGLKAKQIADKLNMKKTDVNRILYDNLSSCVECDDSFRWRVSAG